MEVALIIISLCVKDISTLVSSGNSDSLFSFRISLKIRIINQKECKVIRKKVSAFAILATADEEGKKYKIERSKDQKPPEDYMDCCFFESGDKVKGLRLRNSCYCGRGRKKV